MKLIHSDRYYRIIFIEYYIYPCNVHKTTCNLCLIGHSLLYYVNYIFFLQYENYYSEIYTTLYSSVKCSVTNNSLEQIKREQIIREIIVIYF